MLLLGLIQYKDDCPRDEPLEWGSHLPVALSALCVHLNLAGLCLTPRLGVLTCRRDVQVVELSFTHPRTFASHLCFGRQRTGEQLVCGRSRLDKGTQHRQFPVGHKQGDF